MPIAPHLTRREAVYYWRRRLPPRLAAFQNRKHVLMTLLTARPRRARSLAVQLDAAFEEILISTEAGFFSSSQTDALLRSVIAKHTAKLNLVAAVGAQFKGYNPDRSAPDDLHVGWAYRLCDVPCEFSAAL